MEFYIFKLVYDYSINGKIIDKTFIDRLVEIVVLEKRLYNYIQRVNITNKLIKSSNGIIGAEYNLTSMDISIYSGSIQRIIESKSKHYQYYYLFNSLERLMFKNLLIVQIILHELEHAYQNKLCDNRHDNSIYFKLINASFLLEKSLNNWEIFNAISTGKIDENDLSALLSKYKNLYQQYYKVNPSERLAQINSYKTIVNLLTPVRDQVPNLYNHEYLTLLKEKLNGYPNPWQIGICPAQIFLFGVELEDVWKDLDFYNKKVKKLTKTVYSKYSLEKRLSLGLPISELEYNSLNQKL